jgi:hypothetical protein
MIFGGAALCPIGRIQYSSATCDVWGCIFDSYEAEFGGAIYLLGTVSGSVSDCIFLHCAAISIQTNAGSGGGIYSQTISPFSFINDSFEECTSTYVCGGVNLNAQYIQYVHGCSFKSCSSQYYGGLRFGSQWTRSSLISYSFISCSATFNTAGFTIQVGRGKVRISESFFQKCEAAVVGGIGIIQTTEAPPDLIIFFVF